MTEGTSTPSAHNVHRGRLFRKYLLLILSLVSLALLVSGGISLYFSYQQNESALASLQHEKAVGAASRIEQYIRQISQQIGYAALPQLDAGDMELRRIEFNKLLRQAPAVTDIAQLDAAGREQIAVSRLGMDVVASGRDRSQEPAFTQARRGQPWFGPVYFRKDTEPYMTVAVRSGGDKGPVAVAEVNLKFIWDVVSRIKIGDKGKAYVVDRNGLLVADPDIGLVLRKTSVAELAHVKAAANAGNADEPAMVSHDLGGTLVLASMAPIEPLAWKVFVEQPVSEVYARLNASILLTGGLLLAGLAVSALAASALARSMVRPIRTLDEGARRIGEGDLDQQIVVKTGDELEGLADQFNRMSAQLRESYAGLERKVDSRTAELSESLEYQTAISEVLRVISQSTSDVVPVFEAIMDSAVRLFAAPIAAVFRHDGRLVHLVGTRGWPAEAIEDARRLYPAPPNPQMLSGRVILAGEALAEEDVRADPDYDQTTAHVGQWRRMIGAPMLKDGVSLGVVVIAWPDPGPTPQRQTDLLKTFADQAVIAIENVRLFNETRQSLERQTATAEILKVISASPTDVQPVFDAIARSAQRLIYGFSAIVTRVVDGQLHLVALTTLDPSQDDALRRRYPMPVTETIAGEVVATKAAQVVSDTETDPRLSDLARQRARTRGYRSYVGIPMLRDGEVIGTMSVSRRDPGAYTDDEVALLQTFADQAVIAIENVRLFNETREALEKQIAIADILRVISRSPTGTQPVFDAIVASCQRLFRGRAVAFVLPRGETLQAVAFADDGTPGQRSGGFLEPWPLDRDSAAGACFLDARVVNVGDTELGVQEFPRMKNLALALGYHSGLFVPLLRDGGAVGAIAILRATVGVFTEPEIALASTFADQAAIAIENVRLFNETKEALERQTATADILRVIAGSPSDVQPVLDAIVRSAAQLFGRRAALRLVEGGMLRRRATSDAVPGGFHGAESMPIDRENLVGAVALDCKAMQVEDTHAATAPPYVRANAGRLSFRAIASVPLARENTVLGVLSLSSPDPGRLSDDQMALMATFADQAVIAIENVRLFNETREALEQQTATGDILRVISGSVTQTQPVFDAIVQSCQRLFDGKRVALVLPRESLLEIVAVAQDGPPQASPEPWPVDSGSAAGTCMLESRVVSIADTEAAETTFPRLRQLALAMGYGSGLWVPLLRDGKAMGCIAILRGSTGGFDAKQIALARTFADQAVIAIENARLFNETKEALEQQTATAEILRVIGKSVADTGPVFDKILDSCQGLFATSQVGIFIVHDDGQVHFGAYRGAALEAVVASFPQPVDQTVSGLAIRERRTVHIPDLAQMADMPAALRRAFEKTGNSSLVWAPMVWEDRGVGSIFVARQPPSPFTDKEISLLTTFADQAVIAIQNSRLFHEIEDKSRQLELANKHKSEFLANMSHELRTPLNAIIGFSEVLSEGMFGDVNAKQVEYLQDIHSSGHHLLRLINDILDLSKIEAGRMELDLSRFHLPLLLDNSATLVRERASRQGLSLALDVEAGLAEWVADERKLKQVVINLLSNAVKFTPAGGSVTLRARLTDAAVEIAVVDTGVGIAPDQHALVFEEFRQAGGDYLRKAEGTGLGLSLAKRFVELHGGTIRVESEPGLGSTFAFILPNRSLEATP